MSTAKSLRDQFGIIFLVFVGLLAVNGLTVFAVSERAGQTYNTSVLLSAEAVRSQRIAKEALLLEREDVPETRAALQKTADLFDDGLAALLHGGTAPTGPNTGFVSVSAAAEPLAGVLREVQRLWGPVRDAVGDLEQQPVAGAVREQAVSVIVDSNLALREKLQEALDLAEADFTASQDFRRAFSVGLMLASLALLAALYWWVGRAITRPLVALSRAAGRLADGDLTSDVAPSSRGDEIGALARSFATMTKSLRDNLEAIQATTTGLAASSSEILAAATELASGAAQGAAAASEIGTSSEEVRVTADEATERAREVAEAARETSDVALAGQAAVEAMQEGVVDLRDRVELIAQRILALSEQTQTIGEITASVEDLADQSNLLAVNAAIEAAKAGEHGRGFAVVAREIRALADQSREATSDIRKLLEEIQKSAHAAVLVTEQGTKGVTESGVLVEKAGEVIDRLTAAVAESADLAQQIATSSTQQRTGIEQVSGGISQIVAFSSQSASAAAQLRTEAEGLARVSADLSKLTARFTLPGESPGDGQRG